ncbi:ricin-type beta-trefoil lectin domain protein [Nonomuraea sp. NPDC049141]|uniref:ricin-type beta-trefoil lectin domain protein n=1 Tax=Nonomuraea sp. NPDC049141 TaxID=3155500 RepID=UPI00340CBE2B
MRRPAKIANVALAATVLTTLTPTAPALADSGYVIKNVSTLMCLTIAGDSSTRRMGNIARTWECQPGLQGYLWNRTARSQLASADFHGKLCIGAPKGPLVLVRRCGADLKHQRFTFTTIKTNFGDRFLIKWKGMSPDTCLNSNDKGQVFGSRCDPGNTNQNWTWGPRARVG